MATCGASRSLTIPRKGKSSTQFSARGYGGSGDSEVLTLDNNAEDEEDQDLDLMYDPILNCYYEPKTNKYYELA